jgi:WD40 repeat protein
VQVPPTKKKRGSAIWLVAVIIAGWVGISLLLGHNHAGTSTSYSDGSTNYIGSNDPSTSSNLNTLMNTVAWSPDGRKIASGGGDAQLQIWDATTAQQITTVNTDFAEINSVAWSPNGEHIAAVGDKHELQVWYASGGLYVSLQVSTATRINALSWSHDNKTIALACNDGALWEVDSTAQTSRQIYQANSPLSAVAWSPNGMYIAAGGGDATVGIWDAATGTVDYTYNTYQPANWINAIAWSPDSKRIVFADSVGLVMAWDALTGKNQLAYSEPYVANALAWSPNGKYLAAGDNGDTVQVWGVNDVTPLYTYKKQTEGIVALAWSPLSSRIASASEDGTVQVWDALSGENVVTYIQR